MAFLFLAGLLLSGATEFFSVVFLLSNRFDNLSIYLRSPLSIIMFIAGYMGLRFFLEQLALTFI